MSSVSYKKKVVQVVRFLNLLSSNAQKGKECDLRYGLLHAVSWITTAFYTQRTKLYGLPKEYMYNQKPRIIFIVYYGCG